MTIESELTPLFGATSILALFTSLQQRHFFDLSPTDLQEKPKKHGS